MSETQAEREARERREWEERKLLEIETSNQLRTLAREVGDVKAIATRTEAKVDEIDPRPPQVEQWAEKVAQVRRNAEAIRVLEPQVANHSAALKWIGGVLTVAIAGILLRWGWLVLQNGVG